jgi:hypothetical protein
MTDNTQTLYNALAELERLRAENKRISEERDIYKAGCEQGRERTINAVIGSLKNLYVPVVPSDPTFSDYPFEAVPKSTILGLRILVKLYLDRQSLEDAKKLYSK